ncbi:MAG: ADYC domain-containing protein, partial [Kofleriaceae bacterium]
SLNGMSLNGMSLNGMSLNGMSLNGMSLNGMSLNGMSLNGTTLNGMSLNGTGLTSTVLTAAVGATFTGYLSSGATLPLRIDTAIRGTGTNTDVGMYGISYQTSSGWQPLCGVDSAGAKILAVSTAGTWNMGAGVTGGGSFTASTTQQTFACRGKAIAKCVELGYKTWTGRTTHLVSCTRLLRGDYCGNGQPYTVDGTLLNLYDNVGIQADAADWVKEAEWTPTGAKCINMSGQVRYLLTSASPPPCLKGPTAYIPSTSTCGTTFQTGTLIINEMPAN